jgi:hypothetical protein
MLSLDGRMLMQQSLVLQVTLIRKLQMLAGESRSMEYYDELLLEAEIEAKILLCITSCSSVKSYLQELYL